MKIDKKQCMTIIQDDLITEIKNKKVALFFGAGLSKSSGNLTSNEIKKSILCSLKYNKELLFEEKTIRLLNNRTIQFEDFLNRIYDDININEEKKQEIFNKLFNILYQTGKPNRNHYVIARLIKGDNFKKVYTTNFDEHLEKAYEYCFNEKLEKAIIGSGININAPYVKLHGCISKENSIGTLLSQVASEVNREKLKPFIKDLLVTGEHDTVLFMGYSFSDVYDIVRLIEEISESEKGLLKRIFIIMHDENSSEIYTDIPNDNNCEFKNISDYNSYARNLSPPKREIKFDFSNITIYRYDTTEFIEKKLCEDFENNLEISPSKDVEMVSERVSQWVDDIDDYYRLLIGWRFNYEAGQEYLISKDDENIDLMLNALEKSLEHCNHIKNDISNKGNMKIILNEKHTALTLISMGKFSRSEKKLRKLAKKCEKLAGQNKLKIISESNVVEIKNKVRLIWLIIDIIANRAYLHHYRIMSNDWSKKDLISFIIKIQQYYNKFEHVIELGKDYNGAILGAYHRYKYLLATLKNHADLPNINEDYFKDAINFYENAGRVEYLAFVYMEYGKFLNNEKGNDYKKRAKELFNNLGYKAYLDYCDS